MKTIRYYFAPTSPWSYMGHDRLLEIAAKHGAQVEPRPIALGKKVFPQSGGVPLPQRSAQRKAYRLVELKRWCEHLNFTLNLQPAYHPVSDELASLMIAASIKKDGNKAGLDLLRGVYRAVWVEDRNIADADTLIQIANECKQDGDALYQAREDARELYDRFTQDAIEQQVFGSPWYIYNDEPFWGQDRLEFLERALAKG